MSWKSYIKQAKSDSFTYYIMNKQPQYIVVNGGKRKKAAAATPLPKTTDMDVDKEEDLWPTSLK